jgi:hypothetical protein
MSAATDLEYLRTHIGHEVKYMTFAAQQFHRLSAAGDFRNVPMQDSTLTRARSLLDFIKSGSSKNRHLPEFYAAGGAKEYLTRREQETFTFISRVLSHTGADRDSSTGRWPGLAEGDNAGLAEQVLVSIEARLPKVRPDCRALLELMISRARAYMSDPTCERFHDMDPARL